ncbi:hypothetical protein QN277_003459 [Acacia crassicarpa]|uniref:Uncharacterized protein n=1 Tax=Acacia crassicarpa TaxID=499986 RepID=A0AAE1IZI9_9FABA|nr:hypothetical protein QN277_003459 [Acacia crassicarpa]
MLAASIFSLKILSMSFLSSNLALNATISRPESDSTPPHTANLLDDHHLSYEPYCYKWPSSASESLPEELPETESQDDQGGDNFALGYSTSLWAFLLFRENKAVKQDAL